MEWANDRTNGGIRAHLGLDLYPELAEWRNMWVIHLGGGKSSRRHYPREEKFDISQQVL
jgi:hypothetical protein